MAQIETTHGGFYNVEETREEIRKMITARSVGAFPSITLTIKYSAREGCTKPSTKGTFVINNIVLITDN